MIVWLLAGSALVTGLLGFSRAGLVRPTALVTAVVAWLLWQLQQPGLTPAASALWTWHVDGVSWLLGGTLLILLVVQLLVASADGPPAPIPPTSQSLLAVALTLLVIGSGTAYTFLSAWILLLAFWGLNVFWGGGGNPVHLASTAGLLLAGLVFMLLAAALAGEEWFGGASAAVTVTATLLAAIFQLGLWPFQAWRLAVERDNGWLRPIWLAFPAAVAIVLLARQTGNAALPGLRFALTTLSLFGILAGVYRTWARRPSAGIGLVGAGIVQASLVMLVALWGATGAVLAEGRVLLLAVAILASGAERLPTRRRWWRAPGPLLAAGALIGLPFTAGFVGRVTLYDVWIDEGRLFLILVLVLLHVPLVASLYWLIRGTRWFRPDEVAAPITMATLLRDSGPLLAAVFLLQFDGRLFVDVSPLAWLLTLIPILPGLLLPRVFGERAHLQATVRRAFAFDWRRAGAWWSGLTRLADAGVRQVAAAWEGDGGLFWLLALSLVFLLAL